MQESKSSAYVVEGDDCFPHLWLVGNYGFAACRPRRFSLTCRMSRGGVTSCERWLVLWLRRGMPVGVAAEAMERSFSVCGKGGVPDFFKKYVVCRTVLDSTGVHIQIATWLAQLWACFSEAFQHCGSCHGGMAEVAGSACQAV